MKEYSLDDLIYAHNMLKSLKADLPDAMNESCDEWREEVRALAKKGSCGPDVTQEEIDSLAEWHREICAEESYPPLLPE